MHVLARWVVRGGGHPGDVGVRAQATVRTVGLVAPQVGQYQVARPNWQRDVARRRVVRVASVWTDGDDRRVVELEALDLHQPRQVLLRVIFGPRLTHRQSTLDRRKQAVFAALERLCRTLVAGDVRRVPGGDDRRQRIS